MTKMLGATCGTTNLTMLHDLDSEYFSRCSDEPDVLIPIQGLQHSTFIQAE